jgi:hypothetical protein
MTERKQSPLRAIDGGRSSNAAVPLPTFLVWRKRATRAERHAERLLHLNKRLLLLPADWRSRVNLSDYDKALEAALDGPDYDFGLFVSRYTV